MTPQTFLIGATCVHLVSDGVFRTDGGGAFGLVPRVLWEKTVAPDHLNRIPMQLRCLVIESRDGLILVDTGYGDKLPAKQREQLALGGERRLIGELEQLGFRPEDVDLVVDTHLHADHCGGNTRYDEDGKVVPAFPRATYMIQRLELADACFPNERTRGTYFPENYEVLGDPCGGQSGERLQVLNGDTQIAREVRTLTTPGHTRAHQSIVVESEGQSAIFLADACAWAVSMERLSWVPAFDLEPMVSIETKRHIRQWAYEENVLLIFQHDAVMTLGRIHPDVKQWKVEREATDV
jgi:glyoxylase-like metal-dependent hydrolase (beta-lactamase superfamily II)